MQFCAVCKRAIVITSIEVLVLGLSIRPLFSDTMADDFFSCYVKDFSCFSSAHHVTPEKQRKLLERRIGTYGTDISGCDIGFSLPSKRLVRLFVDISSNCTAKLYFEDDSGAYVSRTDYLSGKLSDTSIYWGHPEHGVAARYGIMGDIMPLLISPHQRQTPLMLKRVDVRIDTQNIRREPSLNASFAFNRDATDIFSRVCETASDADAARQVSSGKSESGELKMVACYEERGCYKAKRGAWVCVGRSYDRRYCVLMKNGRYHTIMGKGDGDYRCEPYYTFPWWNEFRSVFPCDRIDFYLVSGDTLIETTTRFQYLSDLDGLILRPRLYQKLTIDGLPMDDHIKEQVDELMRHPEEFFTRRVWIRIADIPKNTELRRKLYRTYFDFINGKVRNGEMQ